jgi:hypothetical protein
MKKQILLCLFLVSFFACQNNKPDSWEAFQKCPDLNCVKEVLAVKDDFLKNPQQVLTDFQATYEKGEDHVIGWLFILRDSVLLNPKRGSKQERLAMQQAIIAAAQPFEKDAKVHEMASSVINELRIADIETGKIIDPMAETDEVTPSICYQYNKDGEHVSCQLYISDNGEYSGYYHWYIDGKDGTQGVLESTGLNKDTLTLNHTYIQEGITATEVLLFLKTGNNLSQLITDIYDNEGNMVIADRTKLKLGNTLTQVDCEQVNADLAPIRALEQDMYFRYPDPALTAKDEKVVDLLQGEWKSLDDPKAGIKIAEGRFSFLYEGQDPEPSLRYIYYPSCPEDCNPIAKMPCLKVIGQDDVCYTIVKADGKSLDISQIDGTGNTNRYVKKEK